MDGIMSKQTQDIEHLRESRRLFPFMDYFQMRHLKSNFIGLNEQEYKTQQQSVLRINNLNCQLFNKIVSTLLFHIHKI